MLVCKCTQKFRNKQGVIYGYRLQDASGSIRDVNPEQLKQAIREGKVQLVNLKLTSDNRLIDKTEQNNISNATENRKLFIDKVDAILNKAAKDLGGSVCYMTSEDGNNGVIKLLQYELFDLVDPDEDNVEYDTLFELVYNAACKEVYLGMSANDGDTNLSIIKPLVSPLYSTGNIEIIQEVATEFVDSFKRGDYKQ